ncbi:unnamed protein product [Caenorhabditis sp. 36 PRJEB53466]|nr:unnamed protein product [Caenorhabditis sp. 36 PRJEB53466]
MESEPQQEHPNWKKYENMSLEELIASTDNIDTDAFDNTRKFNPRKQRSCHRRQEPVSVEQRKAESSKNSREYTKRNREEIKVCHSMKADFEAMRRRFERLVRKLEPERQERKILAAIERVEVIMKKYLKIETSVSEQFGTPDPQLYLIDYRTSAKTTADFVFHTGVVSYQQQHEELAEQYKVIEEAFDSAKDQKEKTNLASNKSRMGQRLLRAKLKTECWNIWMDIETMKMRGHKLKTLSEELKELIWTKILGVYYHIFNLFPWPNLDPLDSTAIRQILEHFSPFSKQYGRVTATWRAAKRPQTAICEVEEIVEEKKLKLKIEEEPEVPPEKTSDELLVREGNQGREEKVEEKKPELSVSSQFTPFTLVLPTVPATSRTQGPSCSTLTFPLREDSGPRIHCGMDAGQNSREQEEEEGEEEGVSRKRSACSTPQSFPETAVSEDVAVKKKCEGEDSEHLELEQVQRPEQLSMGMNFNGIYGNMQLLTPSAPFLTPSQPSPSPLVYSSPFLPSPVPLSISESSPSPTEYTYASSEYIAQFLENQRLMAQLLRSNFAKKQ